VRADEIRVGDRLRLRPGEIVPVDGRVASGRSFVDTSVLTGEAQPRSTGPGDCVFAGTTLLDGTLEVDATAVVGTRMRDEIARLLQAALASRGQLMRIADRLAAWLVPLVLVLAVLVVVARWRTSGPEQACLSGLAVVLISCPCALGIATPLAFWRAMGAAWRRGVLVRGGETLEALARVRRVAFDKTGTLTSGEFELEHVHAAAGFDARTVLAQAAALELGSEHPIARSLRRAARASGVDAAPAPRDFEALPGVGVCGTIEGQRLRLIGRDDARFPGATVIALEDRDGERARFVLRSRPRPEAAGVLARLRALGCELEILTGDGADAAQAVARELDVAVAARLTPAQKVERVSSARVPLAFVGDGLNDAAALAAADVGISVAGSASTSLAAAHVNLLEPGLHALPDLLDLARAAVRAARLNLAWAFGYNAIGLYLAATGRLSPIFAASAMVVSSLFSVLNSSRAIPLRRPMRAESASAAGPAVEPTRAARFALLRAPAEAQ
jgi:heavy metal translocating P-type ATPase